MFRDVPECFFFQVLSALFVLQKNKIRIVRKNSPNMIKPSRAFSNTLTVRPISACLVHFLVPP